MIHEHSIAELRRRAQLLPEELAAWKEQTEQNADGMGLHKTQVAAINLLFEELVATHEGLLAELDPALEADEFAELCGQLEAEISGAHGLMSVFRHILAQRAPGSRYHTALDMADLIAAACYRPYIQSAIDWGLLREEQCREPPLTFLNARSSPAAMTRRHTFAGFGFDLESYEEMVLPVPLISLRFHDTAALWSLCSIYHEAGHILEQDLGLGAEVAELLAETLADSPDEQRLLLARFWVREMLADAFGLLLGGAGFAFGLADILLVPPLDACRIQPGDRHPVPYVRIRLLGALLRQTGVNELAETAREIESTWQQFYGPPPDELKPYLDRCDAVAGVLLDESLARGLGYRRLLDLAPDMEGDDEHTRALARYLYGGEDAPDASTFPIRLVPAAACLAVHMVTQQHDQAYEAIQGRTMAFTAQMPRPEFMDHESIAWKREQHLRKLAKSLRFAGHSPERS